MIFVSLSLSYLWQLVLNINCNDLLNSVTVLLENLQDSRLNVVIIKLMVQLINDPGLLLLFSSVCSMSIINFFVVALCNLQRKEWAVSG